nr:hypothetical protein HK105_000875 [Polyrhizophydium stewartii]
MLVQRLTALLSKEGHSHQLENILGVLVQVASVGGAARIHALSKFELLTFPEPQRPDCQERMVQTGAISALKPLTADRDSSVADLAKRILAHLRSGPSVLPRRKSHPHVSIYTETVGDWAVSSSSLPIQIPAPSARASGLSPVPTFTSAGTRHLSSPKRSLVTMTATASILPSTSHRHIVQPTTIPDAPVFFRHPPILTNAVHLFDVVHLSPLDQQDIDGFSSTVAGPLDIIEVEEKRFDIICLDFGPQIFLQQPQLLRLVLAGLDSPQIGRQAQNLEYLERIVDAWRSMLRAFLVSSVAPDVVTPLRTTPNPSIDGVSQWAHQETNAGFDQAISLPYASHEIFVKLVALLRPTVLCSQALRVIERLIPFIKIHIETAISHTSRELNPHRLPELCHFYFHQLVSQTRYFDLQRGPTGELLFDHELASPVLEHQVVLLAVRAVWMFSDLDEVCQPVLAL